MIHPSILEAVGRTPLVRLNKVVAPNSAAVLVKCEYMNPTGSIKDRMAVHILNQSEKQGLIKAGATIVENTSGNTGQGVAMWAAVRGYRCVFTMPDKMSLEKVNMLKAFGADVAITPTDVPGDSPQHYVETAKRIARETPGAFYVNQYHNPLNIEAHELSTGPEILRDTEGKVDAVVAGAGTGGTISGIGRYFKKNHPHVRVIGVDPIGSVHYNYFYTKTMPTPHVYKVEGIGEDILCDAMDYSVVDEFHQTNDREAFSMVRRLVREEGLFCGGSSGCNVHIAVKIAQQLGAGKTVVTVLPDSATRYTTKFLNDTWMKDYGFLGSDRDLGLVEEVIRNRPVSIITAHENDTIESIIALFKKHGVSQVPIVDPKGRPVSIVAEVDVLRGLQDGSATKSSPVSKIAQRLGGLIYPKARIEELYRIFETNQVAIVVDNEQIVGVVSQIDVIDFLSKKGRERHNPETGMSEQPHRFATNCVHAGQAPDPSTGAIMTPVYMTSTFVQSSPGVFKDGYDYARSKNPTRTALEANIAALEGGKFGLTFSSGLAAMDCVLHQLRAGDHVVLSDDVYGGTFRQLDKIFRHVNLTCARVDMTKLAEVEKAITARMRLVWLETPSNPTLKVIDIAGVRKLIDAAARNMTAGPADSTLGPLGQPLARPIFVVDNTFASPYLQNPLAHGADVAMHSCTKYIGGHSDLVAGVLVTSDAVLAERLRYVQNAVGAVPGAMDCFMMIRSTKTLHLRMQRHCENALELASWLEKHPKIERVIYPGLASHPQHELAKRQMRAFGGMISCIVKGGLDPAKRVLERTHLFALAESLGGVESLIEHPAIMTHSSIPEAARAALGIADGLIRLSVGVEDVEDLRRDLATALG